MCRSTFSLCFFVRPSCGLGDLRFDFAAADRHTIYDRAKQLDRSSGSRHPRTKTVHQRVSQHHMTLPSTSTLATPRKRQQQSRIAGHPDHTTDVRKNREKMWIYTLRSIAPHGNYGSNQTDSHTPHSTSLLLLWVGLDKPYLIAGHIRKNTNDQTDSGTHRHHVKPYPALAYRWHNNGPPMDAHANYGQSTMATLWRHKHQRARPTTTRAGTSPWRPKTP